MSITRLNPEYQPRGEYSGICTSTNFFTADGQTYVARYIPDHLEGAYRYPCVLVPGRQSLAPLAMANGVLRADGVGFFTADYVTVEDYVITVKQQSSSWCCPMLVFPAGALRLVNPG